MERQRFDNVWDAIEDTPSEAANMTMRSMILVAIEQQVRCWNMTQSEAARRLGITQPRLNDLLRGRVANFSLDTLINLAAQAGLEVRIEIAEAACPPLISPSPSSDRSPPAPTPRSTPPRFG